MRPSGFEETGIKLQQTILYHQYRAMAESGKALPSFAEVEFRVFSQNGEDGILLYLFALLGTVNRRAVEICAGDGLECNTANLTLHHGWETLLMDGDEDNVARGLRFYRERPETRNVPPRFLHAWVTRENINDLLLESGFSGEVDLLSLDIDGVDYWVWEAIEAIQPRVVVAEIQCLWGDKVSVTVPYNPNFRAEYVDGYGIYSGASLQAFIKLAARKGYRFVGMQRLGFNAFFVRQGVGEDVLPAADPVSALKLPFVTWARKELLPLVKDRAWVEV